MYEVNDQCESILEAHGLKTTQHKGWILINGVLPAIKAYYHEPNNRNGNVSLRLDIEIALEDGRAIYECFSGVGSNVESALTNGFQNFCYSSLHVLLATFWGIVDEDQVLIEKWSIGDQTWKVIIGNFIPKSMGGVDVDIPKALFPTIEKVIRETKFIEDLNWLRMFYCHITKDQQVSEFLINNEVNDMAQNWVSDLEWSMLEYYYSVRNFLILDRM